MGSKQIFHLSLFTQFYYLKKKNPLSMSWDSCCICFLWALKRKSEAGWPGGEGEAKLARFGFTPPPGPGPFPPPPPLPRKVENKFLLSWNNKKLIYDKL